MARDPADDDAFVFDLVDDAGGDAPTAAERLAGPSVGSPGDAVSGAAEGGTDGDEDPTGAPLAGGGPTRWPRRLAPVAAVLAIALGTGYALDGVREAERIDRILGVSGGVVDLSSPLEELWTWEGEVGVGVGPFSFPGVARVATLDDLLVFMSEGDLLALDSTSGAESWVIPLGEAPECGPVGYPIWDGATAAETMVCLQGAGQDREVIAVGSDGAASAPRVLDAADEGRYGPARPGPDGTVLRAKRVGPASAPDLGDAECASDGACAGTVEAGRDIEFRAEDAVTGAERWSVTVPFEATPAANCYGREGESWGELPGVVSPGDAPDPEAFGARIRADLVHLYGCGANASVTSDGVLLRGAGEPGAGQMAGLTGGGYIAWGSFTASEVETIVYSADGDVDQTFAGYVSDAGVVDGPGLLVGSDGRGPGLRAYEPDGTPRWESSLESSMTWFIAQVGETAVVLDAADRAVHGLDATTGDERWVLDLPESGGIEPLMYRAFTDGRHVLVQFRNEAGSASFMSLDAVTGEQVWEQSAAEVLTLRQNASLVPVGGNLLAVTPAGVSGLG